MHDERLLGGDGEMLANIYRQRVLTRGKGAEVWGWGTAYGPGGGQQGGQGAGGRRQGS